MYIYIHISTLICGNHIGGNYDNQLVDYLTIFSDKPKPQTGVCTRTLAISGIRTQWYGHLSDTGNPGGYGCKKIDYELIGEYPRKLTMPQKNYTVDH